MGRGWQWLAVLASLCVGFMLSHFGLYNNLLTPNAAQQQQQVRMLSSAEPTLFHAVSMAAGPHCNCSFVATKALSKADTIALHAVPSSINCSCSSHESAIQKVADEADVLCDEKLKMAMERAAGQKQTVVKYEPWYAEHRTWHYPVRFPRCTMDVCFNYSRCENAEEMLVYSYDVPSPPVRYFERINETKWHTGDPQKACFFFVFLDLDNPHRPDIRELPHWHGGMNHVLITFADTWRQRGPPEDVVGYASIMATDMHQTTYRAGFDISITLPANHHIKEFQSLRPSDRKYLLTFRGLRYLGSSGEGTLRSHPSFRGMHNGVDVIVATSCKHFINDLKRSEHPELGAHCDEDDDMYRNFSFHDLMNTTFGLVPAGMQPNCSRFIEVLSAGAIPVLIADNYVKPFDTLIQWHHCLLQFPTSEMHRIVPTVRALKMQEVEKRQRYCLGIYHEFFKDGETLLRSTMSSLEARFLGMFPIKS